MSEKAKAVHDAFCDYEIKKIHSTRIVSVKESQRKPKGVKTHNCSKAILATRLAVMMGLQ